MASRSDRPSASPAGPAFRLRGHVLAGIALGLLLVVGCGGWAASAHISGAIIAAGSFRVDQHVKEVQHADGGIIAEILVEEGDAVAAGEVLIRLEDVQTRAELSIVLGQLVELRGREARLLAESRGDATIDFPVDYLAMAPAAATVAGGEEELFDGSRLNRERNVEQLMLQIVQLRDEVNGLEAQREAVRAELALVEAHRDEISGLVERGILEGSRTYTIAREVTRMHGERGEISASIARAAGRISEIELQILAIGQTARNEAQRELREIEGSLAELLERRRAAEDRLDRAEIRSPIAGVINELNVTTVGGVVTPAEPLATIVPADARLTVEVRLRTTDIDQISIGQSARLRLSAFSQRTTPEIAGRVTYISAAAQQDEQSGEAFYLGTVAIDDDHPFLDGVQLLPGMPVEVFIETTQMTALAYLAKPLTDQINRAFREE